MTSSHTACAAAAECGTGGCGRHLLALLLGAVAVDGSRREAGARQEVLQRVGAALRLHEHQRQALRPMALMSAPCSRRGWPEPQHADKTVPAAATSAWDRTASREAGHRFIRLGIDACKLMG